MAGRKSRDDRADCGASSSCGQPVIIAERSAGCASIRDNERGVWWAMVTITTMGYDDRFSVTRLGSVAVIEMLVGMSWSSFSQPTLQVTSWSGAQTRRGTGRFASYPCRSSSWCARMGLVMSPRT